MELIKDLLVGNDYAVTAESVDGNCVVNYPARLQFPQTDSFEESYIINTDGVNGILIPSYAIRPYILTCIYKMCLAIGYDTSAIMYYDGIRVINEEEFSKLLNISPSEENGIKEIILLELLAKIFINGQYDTDYSEYVREHGIEDGYDIIMKGRAL